MENKSLKSKTTKGLLWSSIERFSNQGVQFLFSIVLARLLVPSDYGIVAMVAIFFMLAQCFIDSGFGSALVRKQDRTEADFNTCFYFNIVVGIVCYLLLFVCAPFIADFYNQPILSPIVRVSGLNVLFNSLCIVQGAQFTFKIDFKSTAKISFSCTIVSGIIGIALAYIGFGVWALVWQGVVSTFLKMVFYWIVAGWRPKWIFSWESFRYLFGYGSKLLTSYLIGTVYENVYPLVIGKFYTPAQLGNYSRALGWAQLPSSNITGILQRVTFPVLSEMQGDEERIAINYRRLIRLSAYIIFPLMIGLAVVASPLIRIVLTEKWDGCVLYLQIICLALMWYPVHAINLNLLEVKGRSDLFLRLEIIKRAVGVVIMIITIPMGVLAMCWGMVISSLISLFLNTHYTGKLIKVGYLVQMRDLLPILCVSCVMGGVSFLVVNSVSMEWLSLLLGVVVGGVLYLTLSYIFLRDEVDYIMSIIRKK